MIDPDPVADPVADPVSEARLPVPLISFVLPVFNVAGYLADCLDSIMCQAGVNIEIIAVNGGSTDRSAKILDDRAMTDARLRVVHLGRIGPGPARNAGVERATGQYIWFVDGDDVVTAGSLSAIADSLERLTPDALMIDFEFLYPNGKVKPSYGRALLDGAPAGCFRFMDQLWLIDLTMTCWSKVIRREFLESADVAFGTGIHEDVPVSSAILLGADKISVLNRVCYRYRKRRRGSFMFTTTGKHFDIFGSYHQVLDIVAKRSADGNCSVSDPMPAIFFDRAIWHYSTILGSGGIGVGPLGIGGLVPRRRRHEFFSRMHEDFVRYKPPGYQPRGGARGKKFSLIEQNAYWTYSFLEPLNMLRVWLLRFVRR